MINLKFMKQIFKDSKGKDSMKRILGGLGVLVGLGMALLPFFYTSQYKPSDTLILGILTISFGAIAMGTFENKNTI
jgi:hypothetical protein